MADFCRQCSIELFGEDYQELAGLCTKEDNAEDLYAWVLCENCGSVQVTWDGRCVSNCYEKHAEKFGKEVEKLEKERNRSVNEGEELIDF